MRLYVADSAKLISLCTFYQQIMARLLSSDWTPAEHEARIREALEVSVGRSTGDGTADAQLFALPCSKFETMRNRLLHSVCPAECQGKRLRFRLWRQLQQTHACNLFSMMEES